MGQLAIIDYDTTKEKFNELLQTKDLDGEIEAQPKIISEIERAIEEAIAKAYSDASANHQEHQFLQYVLYQINRLRLFWYDDLNRYVNENSTYLKQVRDRIETAWQQWELSQLNVETLQSLSVEEVKQALRDRCAADVDPPLSANGRYLRDHMTETGYRRLLAIASLDGLVEASQLSRTIGGVSNDIHAVLTRLLVEEYGAGRLSRKHSTFFATMLETLDMDTTPEAYLNLVPWEVLAIINQSFLLSDRKQHFLRYIGGLLYGELTVPATFVAYQAAGQRLGMPDEAMSYWNLHIKVDELHGQWMLDDVALPLTDRYPNQAWELLLGYDQQRHLGRRAGKTIADAVQTADRTQDYRVAIPR